MLDPAILVPAIGDAFRKLDPRAHDPQPGDVRGRGRRGADHGPVPARPRRPAPAACGFSFQIDLWLWFTVLFANFAEAVAEGRGKAQAATLRQTTHRDAWPSAWSTPAATRFEAVPATDAQGRRPRPGRGRRPDPGRRRGDRGRRLGRRGGDHRRIRAGDPRERRRPLGRHRRHARLSDWIMVRITAEPGLDLPRPHDRAGRRRGAAEDAERDRAQHPARRPDADLPLRRGHASRASPPMPAARSRCSSWSRCSSP